ncbi:MAG: hypothetical protein QG636_561 [Patescibacteria group bacterium]|nr:hypothetical protein [Patescibacteria group bacterium]
MDSKSVPVPVLERIDEAIQNPNLMFGVMAACFVVAAVACVVSHLGSDTHGRPR